MSRIRKIYNLRKNQSRGLVAEQSRVSEFKDEPELQVKADDKNVSAVSQNGKEFPSRVFDEQVQYQVDGEELSVNRLQLNFEAGIKDIAKQDVKIKNIGYSAVYVDFCFLNSPKINPNGFKDTNPKFHCHYQNTVIKPGEEAIFTFSFISQFPGNFAEEVQICCQPPLRTPIPNIKLNGCALVQDQWLSQRTDFASNVSGQVLENQVREILSDIVAKVRLPPPPKPDVRDPVVAERQFQLKNSNLNLFFNAYLHNWLNQLFNQLCDKGGVMQQDRYWDQSVQTLQLMIDRSSYLDQVDKKCFNDRLEHYCYLSMNPSPSKSQLYATVYKFVTEAAYNLGGDYVDAARKELDMWEIPFREPLQTDTEEELKARKDQVDKIKAEWVKRAKKKKWGEQEEKQMVNEFKKKAQQRVTDDILNRFSNFEEGAQFIKTREIVKKSTFKLPEYHKYLERVKTVRESTLDGKKVMIKWHLKLKDNCEEQLKALEEYLTKKKEQERRLEEEKKEGTKKKKAPKPKKKGQKEEEEEKPLFFDFMSILDEENWNGFTQTFKVVLEKQPFLVLIGITYGPRTGRDLPEYSVQFLLQHLRTIESGIDFFSHDQLPTLKERIETEAIGEGSILLLENLNFLPWEVGQEEIVEPAEQGKEAKITKRKLLHPEIRQFFDNFRESVDVIVSEDRFSNQLSGFTAYINREVIMGTLWWRYVGLSLRIIDSSIVIGGDFTPQSCLLLSRLAPAVRELRIVGKAGAKFLMLRNKVEKLGNIVLGAAEKEAIANFSVYLEQNKLTDKLKLPQDLVLQKVDESGTKTIIFDGKQIETQGFEVIDIGEKTVDQISKISQGHLFVLGETAVSPSSTVISSSLTKILRIFFKKQQIKKQRHAHQSSTPLGIDYNEDLVIYLAGIRQNLVQRVQLKQKKVRIAEDEEEAVDQEQEEGEGDRRKIELVSDFRLSSLECLWRLWDGRFDMNLKDLSKYPLIVDE